MSEFSDQDLRDAALTKKRRPTRQRRSIRTVARILAAARSLLARIPYDQVTTTRIAAEDGVSVGALYRFFPDIASILDTIARDHLSNIRIEVERVIVQPMGRARYREGFDPAPLFLQMFDIYVSYLDAHADFQTITFGFDRRKLSTNDVWERRGLTTLLADFMGLCGFIDLAPGITPTLMVAGEAGERLIAYAFEQPTREQRDLILAEARKMLTLHLFPKHETTRLAPLVPG